MTQDPAMHVSRRGQVPAFEVMAIVDRVARLRAEGRDVLNLCVGEPIGGAPEVVRRAMAEAMEHPSGMGYSPALGLRELRDLVAGHYRDWYGLEVDAEQVAITTGSSGAFLLAFLSAFDAGDRVALPRPGYPAYANILRSLDLDVVELPAGAARGYRLRLDDLAAQHARSPLAGVVVASPNNPTGTMLDADEMTALASWCQQHGVRLVSDEIYHGITAGESPGACAWSTSREALVVSSFSKYWGMTGWRLGWLLVPDDLLASVDALSGNLALCAPVPSQRAALAAFSAASHAQARQAVAEYDRARDIALAAAGRLGWRVAPADGAFYVYADVSASLRDGEDSRAFCSALLDEAGVALTPGWDFDRVDGGGTIRLSLSVGAEVTTAAMDRVEAWLSQR